MSDNRSQLGEKVQRWFKSDKGAKSLKISVEKALKNNEQFKKHRHISPEILRKPVTI